MNVAHDIRVCRVTACARVILFILYSAKNCQSFANFPASKYFQQTLVYLFFLLIVLLICMQLKFYAHKISRKEIKNKCSHT